VTPLAERLLWPASRILYIKYTVHIFESQRKIPGGEKTSQLPVMLAAMALGRRSGQQRQRRLPAKHEAVRPQGRPDGNP
jgi:hypothetical protein